MQSITMSLDSIASSATFAASVSGLKWFLTWAFAAVGTVVVLSVLSVVTNWGYLRLQTTTAAVRIAFIIFAIATLFAVLMTLIAYFSGYAPLVLRCLFLAFVILIPPGLYYLFIATRRDSLLNSYVQNLSRLGLLRRQRARNAFDRSNGTIEAENDRVRRVRGYIERFEALYGKLPDEYIPALVEATRDTAGKSEAVEFPKAPGVSAHVDLKTMLPVISAMILSAIGWVIVLPPSQESFIGGTTAASWSTSLRPDVSPVAFAFVGSYFFSIQMLLRRFVRRDLGPNAYNDISARMILSIIGVWVLQQGAVAFGLSAQHEYLYVIAFAIGVFPQIIWQLVTGSIKRFKVLSIVIPNLTASMPLSSLDGLSVWHQARLEEEDIENIPNLAMADIVELMLTTKFPSHRIIDWIDQALLRMIIGETEGHPTAAVLSATLRSYGVRTATTLVAFCMREADDGQQVLELLPAADRPRIRTLAAALSTAPNLPLVQTWLGLPTNKMGEVFPAPDPLNGGQPPRLARRARQVLTDHAAATSHLPAQ